MTFKLTEAFYEIDVDGGPTYKLLERQEENGLVTQYRRRRVRFNMGPERFWFSVVDDTERFHVDRQHMVVRGDEIRSSGGPHTFHIERGDDDVKSFVRNMAGWIASGDLRGRGAGEAVYSIFYVLEVQPYLRRGTPNAWLATWCTDWWNLLVTAFGAKERVEPATIALYAADGSELTAPGYERKPFRRTATWQNIPAGWPAIHAIKIHSAKGVFEVESPVRRGSQDVEGYPFIVSAGTDIHLLLDEVELLHMDPTGELVRVAFGG